MILLLVILLSLYNLFAIRRLRKRIHEVKDSIQAQISWTKEDLRNDLSGIRSVMTVLAEGGLVTPDMIEEGRPFADMPAASAVSFLSKNPKTFVLDVRTSSEFMAGHIPGATLIPVDEVETRTDEIPRNVPHILVTCQGGMRSAAACQILSSKGYTNLINMSDGMGSWPSQREIGVPIRPPASSIKVDG